VTDAALRKIAADYTREPACGSSSGCWPRRCARRRPSWPTPDAVTIDEPDLVATLAGRGSRRSRRAHRGARRGHRLAVTGLGGDVLYIEAGATDGEPACS
jgi:ATP-dependent Lon protease